MEDPIAHTLSVAVVPMVIYLAFYPIPWLPPESITANGSSFVGYVTESNSEWTDVLRVDGGVTMAIYETSDISRRVLCRIAPTGITVTLRDLVSPYRGLPRCPSP